MTQKSDFEKAVRKLEPEIAQAFIEAIRTSSGQVDFGLLVDLIEGGDIEQAALMFGDMNLFPFSEKVRAAYMAGGGLAQFPRGVRGVFGFDGSHPDAVKFAAEYSANLVSGLKDDIIKVAKVVITHGIDAGRTSKTIATELVGKKVGNIRVGGHIGLSPAQSETSLRWASKLRTGDFDGYFDLKLRDKRYDEIVRRAMDDGRGLKADDLQKVVEANRQKTITYRGRVIGRNEAHTALSAGRNEAYSQAIGADGVEAVKVRWQHNLSEEPRQDHVDMSGTVIDLGQTFDFSDGAHMKYPHDPAGGAGHSIGCRCVAIYRVEVAA